MKKSSSYRETFRRHWKLLSIPIVVATLIGGWLVVSAPKSYRSTTSLWVNSPSYSSANAAPGATAPAADEQNVLSELLSTQEFLLTIGRQSGLGQSDHRILAALGGKVISVTPGPQVLQISLSGPNPAVTQNTLRTLVSELQQDAVQFNGGQSRDTFRVIDPATPGGLTASKKKDIEGILGGLVAGLVISLLGTIALTRSKTDPWEDEMPTPNAEPIEPAERVTLGNRTVQQAHATSRPSRVADERRSVSDVRKPG